MRRSVRDFVALAEAVFGLPEPIYEFGSYQVEGQEESANLRPLFPGKKYTGCDIRPGKGVDLVQDIESPDLPEESAGTIVCVDTLEHVRRPQLAVERLEKLLRPGGILLISSVMDFPIHNHPHDYWRFTPEGFRFLVKSAGDLVVGSQGPAEHPHTVFAAAFKGGFGPRASRAEEFCRFAAAQIRPDLEVKPYKMAVLRALAFAPGFRGGNFSRQVLARYLYAGSNRFEIHLARDLREIRG